MGIPQLNSDTNCLQLVQPHSLRTQSYQSATSSDASLRSNPRGLLVINLVMTPSWGSVIARMTRNLGKHFIYIYWFIIKYKTQEQTNERDA